ncbi:MAG: ABC transporter ATP-binding protein [Acidimicrobiia bacterium]
MGGGVGAEVLRAEGITKRFTGALALDGVDFGVQAGEVHVLLGENGAGKSTLMKILSGMLLPDSGTVTLDGQRLPLGSPRQSLQSGIGMLHQEPLVCLPFTAAENFRLGSHRTPAESAELLTHTANQLGFMIEPSTIASSLSVGERQQLEIVRLLAAGVRVLILDEPTSGITASQRHDLFEALRRLADNGLIVLFVSHKLDEVNQLCRSVTVMRRGRVVGNAPLPKPESELVAMMFERAAMAPSGSQTQVEEAVVASITLVDAGTGRSAISEADLQIRAGEVVGLAGLEGSGQTTVLRAMAGLTSIRRGKITVDGIDLTHRPQARFAAAGVAFLPGGRLEEGLIGGLSIAEHLALARGTERLIDWPAAAARAQETIDTYRVKGRPMTRAEQLSGGNQQRLLLALLPEPLRLLLMEHPTRGLDLESAVYIWNRLLARRNQGTAIVFASSDLDELLAYSDRIMVCFDGRIIATVNAGELTVDKLGALIGGKVAS